MRASAIPGIALTFASSALAYVRFAARSRPATCKSIGAGTPKFRTWLTISAGGEGKGARGDCWGEIFRTGLFGLLGCAWLGLWVVMVVTSGAPAGAGVFYGMSLALEWRA